MASSVLSSFDNLFRLMRFLAKKIAWLILAWIVIFFISQLFAKGPWILMEPAIGAIAGATAGWAIADDAASEAGFTGIILWVLLVLACWLPIWGTQGAMAWIMGATAGWKMTFGQWMLLTMATIFSLIASIWRALADD
jgi:hypothetical protein